MIAVLFFCNCPQLALKTARTLVVSTTGKIVLFNTGNLVGIAFFGSQRSRYYSNTRKVLVKPTRWQHSVRSQGNPRGHRTPLPEAIFLPKFVPCHYRMFKCAGKLHRMYWYE